MQFTSKILLLAVFVALASPAGAAIFVVESTADTEDGDPGDGACRDAAAVCTLRAAIEQANASAGADTIQFAIPGAGPHTIRPTAFQPLPDITSSLVIDGYSQPGASVNTLPSGTNAVIPIVLDGPGSASGGVRVTGGQVVLRGLAIRNFQRGVIFDPLVSSVSGSQLAGSRVERCINGIEVVAGSVRIGGISDAHRNLISDNALAGIWLSGSGTFVINNLIGTNASGNLAMGNNTGVLLPIEFVVGGSHVITDNVISGNTSTGIYIGSNGNTLVRNWIGLGADGSTPLGSLRGIDVQGTQNQIGRANGPARADANVISANDVGVLVDFGDNTLEANYLGTGPGGSGSFGNGDAIVVISDGNVIGSALGAFAGEAGNVIAFSSRRGIALPASPFTQRIDNALRGNLVFGNALGDVDLAGDGFFFNDPGDPDEGPNRGQNAPEISAVTASQGVTRIEGELDTLTGPYTLDFYSSAACDAPPDTGSARFYLGSGDVLATAGGIIFDLTLATTPLGRAFTAMATDAHGNSSELGPCFDSLLTGSADLALEVAIDPDSLEVEPGDAARFEVILRNAGLATATNVPVRILRPAGFASWSSTGPGSYDESTGIWSAGDLTPGAALTRGFDVTIDAGAVGPLRVEASAEQGLSEPDTNLVNNLSSAAFEVRAGADLVVMQSAPISAQPGDAFLLDVSVRNDGPETAMEVLLSGVLDLGLELDAAGLLPDGFSYNAATRRWSAPVGELAEGATAQITLPLRVAPATPIGVGLMAGASAAASTPRDPSPAVSSLLVGTGPVADVGLSAPVSRSGISGTTRTYRLELGNAGPEEAPRVFVTFSCVDPFSDLFVFGPAGASCGDNFGCPVVCSFGPLPPGTSFAIEASMTNAIPFTASVVADPSAPYIDPYPDNDTVTAFVSRASCGLLGIEAPLSLGLILLLRGRRGRAALRRLLPGSALALTALLGASALPADATPLAFSVDSAASHATVSIASSLGSPPPSPLSLAGSVNADVSLDLDARFGLAATSLQLTGGALAFSDASIPLSSFPLYDLVFASHDVGADLSGPATSGLAVGPGLTAFDLFGAVLAFDSGTVDATGNFFGATVSETLDLSQVPFRSTFPLGSVAGLEVVDLGGGVATLRLTTPFSAVLRMSIEGEPVTVTIAGSLALTGSTAVPEPGTASLVGTGLLALSALRMRENRRVSRA